MLLTMESKFYKHLTKGGTNKQWIDKEGMKKWHEEFEKAYPEDHQFRVGRFLLPTRSS